MRSTHRLIPSSLLSMLAIATACTSVPASVATLPVPDRTLPTIAFVGVAVVPMDSERVLVGQTVLVRGGAIAELGPVDRVRVPVGATRIDGRGKFLIPGLADMHTHLKIIRDNKGSEKAIFGGPEGALLLLLANGVTTIRNVDYQPGADFLLGLRARAAAGEILSPRIYTSGSIHEYKGSPTEQVAAYKAAGYDFIKIHDEIDDAINDTIATAAHQVGIPIMGHINSVQHAIQLGYTSIEHLMGYKWSDPTQLHQLVATTQRAGLWNCPTQLLTDILLNGVSVDTVEKWPEMRYVPADLLKKWDVRGIFPMNGISLDRSRQVVKALQDAGAGLLSGTDTGIEWMVTMVPGFALHHELQALVRSGLTPYQALTTSTRNVAAYFGTSRQTGTVTVGKRADLVLLRGNPLVDIRNTEEPTGVMIGGRWLPREELDRLLAASVSGH